MAFYSSNFSKQTETLYRLYVVARNITFRALVREVSHLEFKDLVNLNVQNLIPFMIMVPKST